ncbi:MAG: hypothetical protein E7218_04300 [Anaerofustis stercorihominis]|nr:hypothetical protein [Anaerofustis stercorihominis]
MKKIFSIMLAVFIVAAVFVPSVTSAATTVESVFTDSVFRSYICEKAGITDTKADIGNYKTALAAIKEISVPGKGIKSIAGIEYCTGLTFLDVSDNKISSVNLTKNTNLRYLFINDNLLKKLDLSKNKALTRIYAHNCRLISVVLPSSAVKVFLHGNALNSVNFSSCLSLSELSIKDNNLIRLNVSANHALKYLWAGNNNIPDIKLSSSAKYETVVLGTQTYTAGAVMNSDGDFVYTPGWNITSANTKYTSSKVTVPRSSMPFALTASGTLDGHSIKVNVTLVNMTGDINADGIINSKDFTILLSKYGGTDAAADLNNDGTVNSKDFTILLSKYGDTTY